MPTAKTKLTVVSDNTKTATAKAVKTAPKQPKLPKSLATCADELYTVRQERLLLDKEVEALKAREALLREHLINNLPKSQASGIAGSIARATVENKVTVSVTNWDDIHAYVLKNAKKNPGVFGIFQRRVNESMVKEMWDAGAKVPGVEPLDVPVVRLNKV